MFRVCWCLIIVFHIFNACFAAVAAVVHLMLLTPRVYQNIWMFEIEQSRIVLSAWSFVVIGIIQLAVAISRSIQSVRARELSFGCTSPAVTSRATPAGQERGWVATARRTSSAI